MKVKVELTAAQDINGMKELAALWESKYPMAKLSGVSCYGTLDIQLTMPEHTAVIPPQIVDARGTVED